MKKRDTCTLLSSLVGASKLSAFHIRSNHQVSTRMFKRWHVNHESFLRQHSDTNSIGGKKQNVNIIFETLGKQTHLTAEQGELLRSALLKRGISPHNGKSRLINCRGLGTCGTCAVQVTSANASMNGYHPSFIDPPERNMKERLRLNFPPHGASDEQSPQLRLSCQVTVQGDVIVRKRSGFWGQNTSGLAEEFPAELWLGDWEF